MLIFIDTNIYFNNWFLRSADFNLFFNFINNSGAQLLVSKIVYAEVNNKYQIIRAEIQNELDAKVKKVQNLLPSEINYNPVLTVPHFDFKNILKDKTLSIEFFDFQDLPQRKIVDRAIRKVRPFQEDDKGYRDTLIWLSLIEHLKKIDYQGEVMFINNNKNDFFSDNGNNLHSNLITDCSDLGLKCRFITFLNLKDFLDKYVPTEEHSHKYENIQEKFLDTLDSEIHDEIETYLNGISTKEFVEILSFFNTWFPFLDSATSHNFEIVEGIEDPNILQIKALDEHTLFINYAFDLRITEISIELALYSRTQDLHWLFKYFESIEESNVGIKASNYQKIKAEATFNLDLTTKTIDGLTLRKFTIKQ